MKTLEEKLDSLIEGIEERHRMYVINNSTFLLCYSNLMYLKFNIGMGTILTKLREYFKLPQYLSTDIQDGDSRGFVFDRPEFKVDIKIFRRKLENMIFE